MPLLLPTTPFPYLHKTMTHDDDDDGSTVPCFPFLSTAREIIP